MIHLIKQRRLMFLGELLVVFIVLAGCAGRAGSRTATPSVFIPPTSALMIPTIGSGEVSGAASAVPTAVPVAPTLAPTAAPVLEPTTAPAATEVPPVEPAITEAPMAAPAATEVPPAPVATEVPTAAPAATEVPTAVPPTLAPTAEPPTAAPTTAPAGAAPAAPAEGGAAAAGGNVELGNKVFHRPLIGGIAAGCMTCHYTDAAQGNFTGPNLGGIATRAATYEGYSSAEEYIRTSIENPSAYVVSGFAAGVMPPSYSQALTPEELDSLVAYLMTLK